MKAKKKTAPGKSAAAARTTDKSSVPASHLSAENGRGSDPRSTNLKALLPDLEELYKDIHSHPELSMQEKRTAGIVAKRLKAAGFEVTTGVGKTGVVGLLRNGDGPTVMLRADMDALPVKEATGLKYASAVTVKDGEGNTVPVMHACGHDMHVTCLVGATTLFAKERDTWRGTLMVVFQPGEETAEGAQAMIDDKLFTPLSETRRGSRSARNGRTGRHDRRSRRRYHIGCQQSSNSDVRPRCPRFNAPGEH